MEKGCERTRENVVVLEAPVSVFKTLILNSRVPGVAGWSVEGSS
jgi:hypothetical protein